MIGQNKFKIWGLEIEEILVDGRIFWKTQIRNPFRKENKWLIGLNEKFLRIANKRGVEKIILKIGTDEIMMSVPDKKIIKNKEKNKEYEERPSRFGTKPLRIYYFTI